MVPIARYARHLSKRLLILLAALCVLMLGTAQSSESQTVTIGMAELLTSLDPPTDWAIAATFIHMNMFDCLVWRNRETAEFEPWLAESWENIDERTWRLKLRQGITFHNGEPFNADAVVWTYQRILDDPSMITHRQWTFIDTITVLNDYEVEITTTDPEPAFLSKMAGTGCGIQAPQHGRAQSESGAEYRPVGTGPFKFVSFARDDNIVLEANEDYWQGAPEIKRLVWRAIPELATRVASLLTGEVDLVTGVPPADWDRINNNPGTTIKDYLTTRVMLLALRAGPHPERYPDWSGVTQDPRIRKAIRLAIDRETLIDVINGMGVPVLSRITPPTLGWDERFYNTFGEYNPEESMRLLEEAGYAGEPLTFHTTTAWLFQRDVAEVVTAMLQAVGLNVNLNVMDITTFREQVYFPYRNQELYMEALGNSFFDPWIVVLSERSDRRERSGWFEPEAERADELIRAAAVEMNPERRREMYIELQEILLEAAVSIPLYQMRDALGINERINWNPPLDEFLWMGNATFND
jgi:peptide/nickel transport system substrate-binding protein